MSNFNEVSPLYYWVQRVLPLVYDDSLSYYELLNKVVKKLNDLIKNNANLPAYIQELIESYITSGAIEQVVSTVIANFILNVKYPPAGLTPAVGDGTADDTIAIQGCIDYANTHGGKAVYFPSGAYLTQSLTLKNNVSLVGFDRNTTRIVLKGGATQSLLNGTTYNNSVINLTLDGNMSIQVNDVNVVTLTGGKYTFSGIEITDGYTLMDLTINGTVNADDIIFGKGVIDSLVTRGSGRVSFDNIAFEELSALSGRYIIDNSVNAATFTDIQSLCNVTTAIKNSGNYSVFIGQIQNATNMISNTGTNVYYDFYSNGGTLKEALTAETNARIQADAALTQTLSQHTTELNDLDSAIQTERFERIASANSLYTYIDNETTARVAADTTLQTNIDYISARTQVANQSNMLVVGKKGANYATINEAITQAKLYCSLTNRVTIFILAGTYNEEIKLLPNPGIDFIGIGKVIVSCPSVYPNSPLYTTGDGYFQNIQFIRPLGVDNTPSYAFHFENAQDPESQAGKVVCVNCEFDSYVHAGVGAGMGQDCAIIFWNCKIFSHATSLQAMYFHNRMLDNITNQEVSCYNCVINSYDSPYAVRIDDVAKMTGHSNSQMKITFSNTVSSTPRMIYYDGTITVNALPPTGTSGITLDATSVNTSIYGLDIQKYYQIIGGFAYVRADGLFTVPMIDADRYDFTVNSASNEAGINVAPTVSITGKTHSYILLTTTADTTFNKSINIELIAKPL